MQFWRGVDFTAPTKPTDTMALEDNENLPEELGLALAYTPANYKDALAVVFSLDQRLARIVGSATEPMLAQIRLSWWRDSLNNPVTDRPVGDAVLDAASLHFSGKVASLIALVDGWENLLQEPPLGVDHALAFVEGRCAAIASTIGIENAAQAMPFQNAVRYWALADLAAKVSLEDERSFLVELAQSKGLGASRLPKSARGIAVLSALGRRALKRGGRPLMEGRGAALVTMKAGLIGS